MPSWLNLTSISGAFTVAAFIAEVIKAFPRFESLRRTFLIFVGGFFLGSILTAASGITVQVAGSDSPFSLLMALCAVGAAVFLMAAVLTDVQGKKAEYYLVMGGMVAAFLGLLVINAIYMSNTHSSVEVGYYDLTLAEKLRLADLAQEAQQYDRAILMIENSLAGLNDNDERARLLNRRLGELRSLQVAADMSALNQSQ